MATSPPSAPAPSSFEVVLGLMTCTGSLVAAGKLQEILPTRPVTYPGQNFVNFALIGAGVLIGIAAGRQPGAGPSCSRSSSCWRWPSA